MSDDSVRVDVSRRYLLKAVAAATAATATVSALADCGPGTTPGMTVDAGTAADFTIGMFRQPGGSSVIVGRDANGFYAYSNICTHQQCIVPTPADAMSTSSCPCHLSRFDTNGNVLPGSMATLNLPHYAVMLNSGHVMVDVSATISDRAARTPAA